MGGGVRAGRAAEWGPVSHSTSSISPSRGVRFEAAAAECDSGVDAITKAARDVSTQVWGEVGTATECDSGMDAITRAARDVSTQVGVCGARGGDVSGMHLGHSPQLGRGGAQRLSVWTMDAPGPPAAANEPGPHNSLQIHLNPQS